MKIPLLTLHQIVLLLKMYTIIISTILDSLYLFSRNNPDYWQLTGCYNSMFSIIIICRIRAEGAEFRFKFQHWCQVFVEFWNMILLLMILSILICICVFTPLIFSSSLIMQKKNFCKTNAYSIVKDTKSIFFLTLENIIITICRNINMLKIAK